MNILIRGLGLELVGGDTMAFDLDRVQKDIHTLRQYLKRPPKDATPEQVHALRTGTRRLEAGLEALALDSHGNERRLLRKLAKLCSRAGKVRDLDVLTGYAAGALIHGEEVCQVELLEILGAEHSRRSRRLYSFADRNRESMRRRLKQTASRLKIIAKDSSSETREATHAVSKLQRQLAAPGCFARKNLHPYRLRVKELRYMLQMENDPANQPMIASLGAIKDAIGEWHDWEKLLEIARKHLGHGSKCKLVALFQATTEEKLERAMSIANAGRQRVQPEAAKRGRKRVQRPGARR